MKTIKEWLEELPEPYRTQALENSIKEDDFKDKDEIRQSAISALFSAFTWSKSKEGCLYWANFSEILND